MTTPKKYYKELFDNFEIKENAAIYEAGSGRGDFIFEVEKFNPKELKGFELSFLHVLYCRTKAVLKKSKAEILYKNFFEADFRNVDIVYMFLVKDVVLRAWQKIKAEAKPGTVVIVLSDKIKGAKYFKKIPTRPSAESTTYFYLYRL